MPTIPAGGPLGEAAVPEENQKLGQAAGGQAAGKVQRSEAEWREHLTPDQYRVLRQKGTEPPFTGALVNNRETGVYRCGACNAPLFQSTTKFESSCGWPSFFDSISPDVVELHEDVSFGMRRIEATCAACGSHLGHRFPDGPPPTGQRYCINSVSLKFEKQ